MAVNKVILFLMFFLATPLLGLKHLVLISAPGSGKGTLSQYLVKKYDYVQVCPGDIFRSEINAQTELGKKIQPIVEKGEYVDEKIVCDLIANNISKILSQNKYFIIDGFPRSEVSFQCLYEFFKRNNLIDEVVFLQLLTSDESCIKRVLDRQVCEKCFYVYNTVSMKPTEQNKCDCCGTVLAKRKADTKEIIEKRLVYFHDKIEPLINMAQQLYKTQAIKTECSIEDLKVEYDKLIQ